MALRPLVERISMLRFLADLLATNGVAGEHTATIVGGDRRPLVHERRLPEGRVLEVRCTKLSDDGGWVVTIDDVTTRRHAEQQVVFMARHDALTSLPNRVVFRERIELAVAQAEPRCHFGGDVSGPRLLQERERHSGPSDRRPSAARGCRSAECLCAPGG